MEKRDGPIAWRPSAEARAKLKQLLDDACREGPGMSRNAIINRAVMGQGPIFSQEGDEKFVDNDPGLGLKSGKVAAERLKAVTSGGVDPEKIAAFQKKVGMTVFDAKKRNKR